MTTIIFNLSNQHVNMNQQHVRFGVLNNTLFPRLNQNDELPTIIIPIPLGCLVTII